MENFNFINWTDLETGGRGGLNRLGDLEISTYQNLKSNKAGAGNYVTLSLFLSEVYASLKNKESGT